jgi:hypothetical protein
MVMGEIVTLPRRGQAGDLDTLGRVAALSVMAVELARLAEHGKADEIEIMLNEERRSLTRAEMLAHAHDMLTQRQALLDAVGERSAAELVEKIAKAIATLTDAETMLADQVTVEPLPRTRWVRPCTTGRRSGKLPVSTTGRDPAG